MRIRPIPLALFGLLLLRGGVEAQVLPPPRVMPPARPPEQLVLPPTGPPVQILIPPRGITGPVLLPAGKPIPTLPLAASPYLPPGYQPSAYQVWQNYGWTYNGWIRPRVFQVGDGGYFLYNGGYFPYVYGLPGRHYSSTIAPAGAPAP
jgi:hypothetical protein